MCQKILKQGFAFGIDFLNKMMFFAIALAGIKLADGALGQAEHMDWNQPRQAHANDVT